MTKVFHLNVSIPLGQVLRFKKKKVLLWTHLSWFVRGPLERRSAAADRYRLTLALIWGSETLAPYHSLSPA